MLNYKNYQKLFFSGKAFISLIASCFLIHTRIEEDVRRVWKMIIMKHFHCVDENEKE